MQSSPQLGTLNRVDARTVWKHEALQFTPWLKDHLEALSDALDLELELPEAEVAVGDFSCDVIASEVGSNRRVVIENQLEPTNHRHLGQLLTYASGLGASIIIWLSPEFRLEHRQALEWLNQNTSSDIAFFGVELELLKIDNSLPAPHFKVVAQPNDWQRSVKASIDAAVTPESQAYQAFWAEFLERAKHASPPITTNRQPPTRSHLTLSAGRSGFAYGAMFQPNGHMRVTLRIEYGTEQTSKAAFDALEIDKASIEQEVGQALSWERLAGQRRSRISVYAEGSVGDGPEARAKHMDWMIDTLHRFRNVFGPRLKNLTFPASVTAEFSEDAENA